MFGKKKQNVYEQQQPENKVKKAGSKLGKAAGIFIILVAAAYVLAGSIYS